MTKRKTAFSTIEMLITIMIFSLGFIPLIILFQNSHKQTAQAKNLMIAQSIGRTIISEIRSKGFDLLEDEINNSNHDIICSNRPVEGKVVPSDPESIEYPEYYKRFKYTVDLSDNRTEREKIHKPVNKISVELEIQWDEPNRQNFKLGFGTVVVKYGTSEITYGS